MAGGANGITGGAGGLVAKPETGTGNESAGRLQATLAQFREEQIQSTIDKSKEQLKDGKARDDTSAVNTASRQHTG